MSIYIHVGQCGNQIALPLWQVKGATKTHCRSLFDEDGFARAIFVDTEPKAVANTLRSIRARPSNVVLDSSGRGNNWAMGFMSCCENSEGGEGRSFFGSVTDAIRREAERTDFLRSVITVGSLGGGTGSGTGSAILQHLR